MDDHSDPNPNDANPSEGRHNRPADGAEPMETGVLPEDFARRLERLKEASGLSWRGLGRALGVDPKRLGHWRKGVGALRRGHALHPPLSHPGCPGGPQILMGQDYRMSFFDEEEQERQEDDGVEVAEEGGRPGRLDPGPRRAQAQRRCGGV